MTNSLDSSLQDLANYFSTNLPWLPDVFIYTVWTVYAIIAISYLFALPLFDKFAELEDTEFYVIFINVLAIVHSGMYIVSLFAGTKFQFFIALMFIELLFVILFSIIPVVKVITTSASKFRNKMKRRKHDY